MTPFLQALLISAIGAIGFIGFYYVMDRIFTALQYHKWRRNGRVIQWKDALVQVQNENGYFIFVGSTNRSCIFYLNNDFVQSNTLGSQVFERNALMVVDLCGKINREEISDKVGKNRCIDFDVNSRLD